MSSKIAKTLLLLLAVTFTTAAAGCQSFPWGNNHGAPARTPYSAPNNGNCCN